jgi:hypothetical protein
MRRDLPPDGPRFAEVGGAGAEPHIKLFVRLPSDQKKK